MVSNESLTLANVRIEDLLSGALDIVTLQDGWVRPSRFAQAQLLALTSCMAWHPGLYRQMARTTAGISIRFATDATELALAVRYDEEPSGTSSVLDSIPERAALVRSKADDGAALVYDLRDHSVAYGAYDGFSVVVDGRPLGACFPRFGALHASLRDPKKDPDNGVVALPGLGQRREVTIWLPSLRGCEVRELWTNGTYVDPLPSRKRMLVIGDASGQGFCSGDPACAWPAVVSERLGLELVNQSLEGQVFQPTALLGADVDDVEHVVIELGLHYRWERCSATVVRQDVRGMLNEASRRWGDARLWVLTPIWFNRMSSPVQEGSCYDAVAKIIEDVAPRCAATVVDGLALMDHSSALFADGVEHPGAKGHAQIARRLLERMAQEDPRLRTYVDVEASQEVAKLPEDEAQELAEEALPEATKPVAAAKVEVPVAERPTESIRSRKRRRR